MRVLDEEDAPRLDTDSATIAGLWIGVGSLVVGVASLVVTLYVAYSKDLSVFVLVASGWIAGALGTIVMTVIAYRLISAISRLALLHADLRGRFEISRTEGARLIAISDFIASRGLKARPARRGQTAADAHGAEGTSGTATSSDTPQ